MNNLITRRLKNELLNYEKDKKDYESLFELIITDDIYNLEAIIIGPKESLYENCKFKLQIKLPTNYPNEPPYVKFITPIIHLNVNEHGNICLDILQDKWTLLHNIRVLLLSIISLLSSPNEKDPFNHELAIIYNSNRQEYEKMVKTYCCEHQNTI